MMRAGGNGFGFLAFGEHLPAEVRENTWWASDWMEAHALAKPLDLVGQVDVAVDRVELDVDPEVARARAVYGDDPFRGAVRRHILPEPLRPSDMEAAAGQAALKEAGLMPDAVDLFLMHSEVTDYAGPTNHGIVAHKLGLSNRTAAVTVSAACGSFIPQVVMATRLLQAGDADHALIIDSSAMSRLVDWREPFSINTGDGAVAAVIGRVEAGLGFVQHAWRTRADLCGAIRILPEGKPEAPWYRAGEFGSQKLICTSNDLGAARLLGVQAASMCREVVDELYDRAGIGPEDVDFFCCAQSAAWFTQAMAEAARVPLERTVPLADHWEKTAHMLCASAPYNLITAWRTGRLKKGDLVLLYSPGAGFSQLAMLYRWNLDQP